MHSDHKILHVSLYVCDFIQTLIKNCLKNVYWLSLDSWFLFSTLKWKWKSLTRVSLGPHGLYSPWNSPGHNTGGGSLYLLQGIFPKKGSNPGLLHCRWILYQLSHKGSPRILEWVPYPFSSGSSQSRNPTRVSYIEGRFFATWTTKEIYIFYLEERGLFQKHQWVISIIVFILKQRIFQVHFQTVCINMIVPYMHAWFWVIFSTLVTANLPIKFWNTIWYHLNVEFKIQHKWNYLGMRQRLTDIDRYRDQTCCHRRCG